MAQWFASSVMPQLDSIISPTTKASAHVRNTMNFKEKYANRSVEMVSWSDKPLIPATTVTLTILTAAHLLVKFNHFIGAITLKNTCLRFASTMAFRWTWTLLLPKEKVKKTLLGLNSGWVLIYFSSKRPISPTRQLSFVDSLKWTSRVLNMVDKNWHWWPTSRQTYRD